jgi:putative intracellular protease/amidase
MDIVILLFDRFTALDAVGPYEVLARFPGATVTFAAKEKGPVRTDTGALAITADASLDEIERADILVVPGGPGQTDVMDDAAVLDFIHRIDATTTWTTSVCTGSLLLGAAGLLEGKQATTHWLAHDELGKLGAEPTLQRVVFQGKVVTAAGVSAGIDMALALLAELAGPEVSQAVQLGIEYDPQPPFNAGSPEKAPPMVVEFLRSQSRFILEGTTA